MASWYEAGAFDSSALPFADAAAAPEVTAAAVFIPGGGARMPGGGRGADAADAGTDTEAGILEVGTGATELPACESAGTAVASADSAAVDADAAAAALDGSSVAAAAGFAYGECCMYDGRAGGPLANLGGGSMELSPTDADEIDGGMDEGMGASAAGMASKPTVDASRAAGAPTAAEFCRLRSRFSCLAALRFFFSSRAAAASALISRSPALVLVLAAGSRDARLSLKPATCCALTGATAVLCDEALGAASMQLTLEADAAEAGCAGLGAADAGVHCSCCSSSLSLA